MNPACAARGRGGRIARFTRPWRYHSDHRSFDGRHPLTLCRNGLHEIAPDAPRLGPKGHEHRCPECYKAMQRRESERKRLSGKGAVYDKTYNDKRGPRLDQYENSPRKRAHDLMKKYGMTLGQAERIGVVPPDVQEALHGDHPA